MIFKINNIHFYGYLVLTLFLVACSDDFLEVTPKGNLIAQNVEDYDRLLDDLSLLTIPDVTIPLGDEVAAIDPFFSSEELRTRRLFKWEAMVYNEGQNSQELEGLMPIIYNYNKIINEVQEARNGTESEKLELEAEARVGRAFTYFTLINYYAKPYDPATASSDLGFPIVIENDITATDYTRNTVQEVYDFIIADLDAAVPYLSEGIDQRHRASAAAAEALLGKVLMFQQEFDLALEHFDAAIGYLESSSLDVALYDYNTEFLEGGVFTPIDFLFGPSSVLRQDDTEIIYTKEITNAWAFIRNELVITPETANLFKDSDLRLNFYSDTQFFGTEPFYPNGMLRKIGPFIQRVGIYLPDITLLRVEARARLGLLEDATQELEAFRAKRMSAEEVAVPTEIATDKDKLVEFIFEERLREFALSGYRWFDMRRLSVDPEYNDLVGYTHRLYNPEGEVLETFMLTKERFALRFGDVVTSQNPNLIENP